MSEWWTYDLRDLLLFSAQTYYRLFELHNFAWWPLPLVMLALGATVATLGARGRLGSRVVAPILAACWLWVGWAFHWQRYAAINPAAGYFALAFGLEALLLLGFGVGQRRLAVAAAPLQRGLGTALLLFALLGLPLLGPFVGRSWSGAEVFGMAPDPTALATLGVLLRADARRVWLFYPLPLGWCLVSGATLWTMDAPDFAVVPLAALSAVGFAGVGAKSGAGSRSRA